ncbi:rRNA adenine N-6-methyltransferase family protein [Staphylococcus saprophyticus]|nr:rRNA adenine N-6-methyltransferase family protein [Staphylococcus saprophyticus]
MDNRNSKNSQNFITSRKYINDILKETSIGADDNIIEIGTGKGHFTKQLYIRPKLLIIMNFEICSL